MLDSSSLTGLLKAIREPSANQQREKWFDWPKEFAQDDGTHLFTPITFFQEGDDLLNFATVEWDYQFDPGGYEEGKGEFTAQGQRLIAVDAP
jgi:hypothetical protein